MKKMTIFVEGQTELYFVDRLLREIIDERHLQVVLIQASGGARGARMLTVLQDSGRDGSRNYYIQIINCGTDNRVASDIRDNYDKLVSEGHSVVIGIRDVYPIPLTEIAKLRRGLHYKLKTIPMSVLFVLGVMEIEAWFLAEHTHFQRIHPDLEPNRINAKLGFNPSSDDMQMRTHPTEDLRNIYALENLAYNKTRNKVQRTIEVLDYADIYLSHRSKFPDVAMLMTKLDEFFM